MRDASDRLIPRAGRVNLTVELGMRLERVSFIITEKLAALMVLGCDFSDKHVEAVRPQKRLEE